MAERNVDLVNLKKHLESGKINQAMEQMNVVRGLVVKGGPAAVKMAKTAFELSWNSANCFQKKTPTMAIPLLVFRIRSLSILSQVSIIDSLQYMVDAIAPTIEATRLEAAKAYALYDEFLQNLPNKYVICDVECFLSQSQSQTQFC
jgi:hypothetical protein